MDSDSSLDSPPGSGDDGEASSSPARKSPARGTISPPASKSPSVAKPPVDDESSRDSVSAEESGPESPPAENNPTSPPSQDDASSVSSQPDEGPGSVTAAADLEDDGDDGSYHSSEEGGKTEERKQEAFKPHAKEDLSDVSDLESQDGLGFDDDKPAPAPKPTETLKAPQDALETELDFEAEEKEEEKEGGEVEDKEEGECGAGAQGEGERSDGEVKDGDDLEEGECTDGDDPRPEETEPRPICRFYNRGQCTWGSNCRFVHPGVTDKGNYTMFDMVRPLVPANGPPGYHDYRYDKGGAAVPGFGFPAAVKEDPNAPPQETAWERGLRHAKEMMRKATKRKESDMDFEEKKMNLGLGQEELDKENDFYTRPASPVVARLEEPEHRWGNRYEAPEEEEYYRQPPPPDQWRRVHYPPGDTRAIRVETGGFERLPIRGGGGEKYHRGMGGPPSVPPEFHHHHHEKRHHIPRSEPQHEPVKWRDRGGEERPERYPEASSHRSRADEWSDPWMRSKSPPRKGGGPPRRQSYSSGSSYSSSSRSSRSSSYSSYSSRSRSRSFSPGGPGAIKRRRRSSPHSQQRVTAAVHRGGEQPPEPRAAKQGPRPERKLGMQRPPVQGLGGKPLPPPIQERKAPVISNQPPPPRRKEPLSPPLLQLPIKRPMTPPVPPVDEKPKNWPPVVKEAVPVGKVSRAAKAILRAKKLSRSRSSPSKSSGSDSDSVSSSDTSSSLSSSSSSSSRHASPATPQPKPAKRLVIDGREALANMVKIKALDALKVSGQKQQIKLTLKGPDMAPGTKKSLLDLGMASLAASSRKDQQLLPTLTRKRPAEPALKRSSSPEGPSGSKGGTSKKAPSRREELLKQLKAVEDAIRRKRFKI